MACDGGNALWTKNVNYIFYYMQSEIPVSEVQITNKLVGTDK